MTTQLYVFPYKSGSASAKALSEELGVPLLRKAGSKFTPAHHKIVVNWGAQTMPDQIAVSPTLNNPARLLEMTNKARFFKRVNAYNNGVSPSWQVSIPRVWNTKADVLNWAFEQPNPVVFARTILNGHSGVGIVELEGVDQINQFNEPCSLFVEYIKKQDEYRVHFTDFSQWLHPSSPVGTPKILFAQRKAIHAGTEPANTRIRNLNNGYFYMNDGGNLELPVAVQKTVENFLAFNKKFHWLEFGALDIIYNKHYNKAYVLEVNTAPGLSGTTLTTYANVFNNFRAAFGA